MDQSLFTLLVYIVYGGGCSWVIQTLAVVIPAGGGRRTMFRIGGYMMMLATATGFGYLVGLLNTLATR